MLQIKQAFLVKKIQSGSLDKLADLYFVQSQIVEWYSLDCEKIKIQSKCEELNSKENVRIYHHELHKAQIKKSSILKLDTSGGLLLGHADCANYLENQVAQLLLRPAILYSNAQEYLLQEVQPIFTACRQCYAL